ncbi:hypothetical protein SC499_10650 [Peribacillus simplex]|uniref:hypothetical protein n=1 Tax=Peribacillus simplex TaxID=1478 RepID=UPI00298DA3AF|nr:hypothetical protein [Peribacillus simplex]MDW7615170.1 hypothetical protein [Peribacillus simplex]
MSNLEVFEKEALEEVRRAINEIVDIYRDHQFFWGNAAGWAPEEAEKILTRSRLDWLHALSESLFTWTEVYRTSIDNEGKLILAWANLGALLEGGIKLFLSVHVIQYKNSQHRFFDSKGKLIEPDVLPLEKLKVFLQKEKVFETKWFPFISMVQQRRNAIHAYKHRDIGNWTEFYESIKELRTFTQEIKDRLPYPG